MKQIILRLELGASWPTYATWISLIIRLLRDLGHINSYFLFGSLCELQQGNQNQSVANLGLDDLLILHDILQNHSRYWPSCTHILSGIQIHHDLFQYHMETKLLTDRRTDAVPSHELSGLHPVQPLATEAILTARTC